MTRFRANQLIDRLSSTSPPRLYGLAAAMLAAITAVVLGGTSIFGGVGSAGGTLLGVAGIAVLSNGLSRLPATMNSASELAGLFTGVLLLVALGAGRVPAVIASLRERRRSAQTAPAPSHD